MEVEYTARIPKSGCPFDGCEGQWEAVQIRCNGCGRLVDLPNPRVGNPVSMRMPGLDVHPDNPWRQPDWDEWVIDKLTPSLRTYGCCDGPSEDEITENLRLFAQLIRARDRNDREAVQRLVERL